MNLYPLKFRPILKERIWGGNRLATLGKTVPAGVRIGESWELSACGEDVSVVVNGYLMDNDLNELVEIIMGELVGERIYQRYGNQFPLLFKFLDAEDNLSVQVHPNDDVALERHGSLGKSEIWYILEAEADASLVLGFNDNINADILQERLDSHTLPDVLQVVPVRKGQVAYLPAGTVHSLGKGIMVAEIQETSDITYRIYDYDRVDAQGNHRDLHIAEALDVIDYTQRKQPLVDYKAELNTASNLTQDVFTVNMLHFNQTVVRDYLPLDSFVVYMCVEGTLTLQTDDSFTPLAKGEVVLIPASIGEVTLIPETADVKLLEVYM